MGIDTLLQDYGYIALVFILFLDGSGVPWPTEATLVAAAVAAHSPGHLNLFVEWASAMTGAAAGASLSYYLGRRMGPTLLQRIGRAFHLSPATMEKVDAWFDRHGHNAVFFGRMIPFVRCFVGYPAGVMEMPFPKYLVYSLAGYGLYIAFALFLGWGGSALAKWVGDLEILLAILIPLGLLVAYFKWARPWLRKRKETGKG